MKTLRIKRFYFATLTVVIFLLPFVGCKDDDDDDDINVIRKTSATLSGANEVPVINTTGSGTSQIDYNVTNRTISYRIDWTLGSLTATTNGMHFHGAENATDTTSSPVVIPITDFTPLYTGSTTGSTRQLTEAESKQLLAGKWYVNVHSSTYPGGELRGNIKF